MLCTCFTRQSSLPRPATKWCCCVVLLCFWDFLQEFQLPEKASVHTSIEPSSSYWISQLTLRTNAWETNFRTITSLLQYDLSLSLSHRSRCKMVCISFVFISRAKWLCGFPNKVSGTGSPKTAYISESPSCLLSWKRVTQLCCTQAFDNWYPNNHVEHCTSLNYQVFQE